MPSGDFFNRIGQFQPQSYRQLRAQSRPTTMVSSATSPAARINAESAPAPCFMPSASN